MSKVFDDLAEQVVGDLFYDCVLGLVWLDQLLAVLNFKHHESVCKQAVRDFLLNFVVVIRL